MIAAVILSGVLLQNPPNSNGPSDAIYDALIRKVDELKAFVAVYKTTLSNGNKVEIYRLAFRAPDEVQFEGMGLRMTVEKGVMTMLGSHRDGTGMWASIPADELQKRLTKALADAIAVEFSEHRSSWAPTLDCGPFLAFKISEMDGGKHDQFGFIATYDCPREPVLGWIETFRHSRDVTPGIDSDHLVMKTPHGSMVTLSTLTGFVEQMKDDQGKSVVLETLDLHPTFDERAFVPDSRRDGFEDQSDGGGHKILRGVSIMLEKQFAAWLSTLVSSKALEWNAEAKTHARKTLDALSSEALALDNVRWQAGTKDSMGTFCESIRQEIRDAGKSPDATRTIDAKIRERREGILQALTVLVRELPESTIIGSKEVPAPDLRKDLSSLHEEVWGNAFKRILRAPLLEAFDDAVSKAKAGG